MADTNSKRFTFPVDGMHCASCVNHVDTALKDVDDVAEATVNLATEKASVTFDNGAVDAKALVEAVQQAGYAVPTKTITLPIEGMHCASCVSAVDQFLAQGPGVLEANVNLATEKATVTVIPGVAERRDLVQAVREAGYDVGATDDEAQAPNRPRRRRSRRSSRPARACGSRGRSPSRLWAG